MSNAAASIVAFLLNEADQHCIAKVNAEKAYRALNWTSSMGGVTIPQPDDLDRAAQLSRTYHLEQSMEARDRKNAAAIAKDQGIDIDGDEVAAELAKIINL